VREAEEASPGCVVGDARGHWFGFAEHLTVPGIEIVLTGLTAAIRARKRPVRKARESFCRKLQRHNRGPAVKVND
jgi:hypothetical protein